MQPVALTREDLYKQVWSEPMTKVAARYEVSGSYMARVCTLLNVPRPERGHWAKQAVGKAPAPEPLPPARPGDPLHWSPDGRVPPPPRPEAPPRKVAVPVRVSRSQVHGLIRGAKHHFENGRPVEEGAYLKPYKKLLVDVTASAAGLDKALALANDLFNALESIGHRVVIAPADDQLGGIGVDEREVRAKTRPSYHYSRLWCPYRPTVVYVGSVAIGLAIVEMSEEVLLRYVNGKYIRDSDYKPARTSRYFTDHSWTTTRELPSGRLRIIAYSPYRRVDWSTDWQETAKTSLRGSIRSIVTEIEEAAPMLVAKLEEAERQAEIARQQWQAAEEKRRRDEDRRRIEQSVQQSREQLAAVIEQWSKVMSVEQFLAGVAAAAADLPEDRKAQVLERLSLAREFLGSQDPLDFFLSWRTPGERYAPLYTEHDASGS